VAEVIAKFDGVAMEPDAIRIAPRNVTISDEMREAIDLAIDRVDAFHQPQLPQPYTLGTSSTACVRSPRWRLCSWRPRGLSLHADHDRCARAHRRRCGNRLHHDGVRVGAR